MFRTGIVVALACVLLPEPMLCRTGEEIGPRLEDGRAGCMPTPLAAPGPVEPCHGAAHGCICQGAITNSAALTSGRIASPGHGMEVPGFTVASRRPAPVDHSLRLRSHPPAPATGRAVRIAHQSFLA